MTRNNFYYLKATVKDLQSAILKNSQSNIDLCYGILLGVRSCGLKIDIRTFQKMTTKTH